MSILASVHCAYLDPFQLSNAMVMLSLLSHSSLYWCLHIPQQQRHNRSMMLGGDEKDPSLVMGIDAYDFKIQYKDQTKVKGYFRIV